MKKKVSQMMVAIKQLKNLEINIALKDIDFWMVMSQVVEVLKMIVITKPITQMIVKTNVMVTKTVSVSNMLKIKKNAIQTKRSVLPLIWVKLGIDTVKLIVSNNSNIKLVQKVMSTLMEILEVVVIKTVVVIIIQKIQKLAVNYVLTIKIVIVSNI